jgi:S-adenosylmethionine:tRNA ribosyltransferase-isomerase
MHVSDFDYPLPEELIAQRPLEERSASRMLVVYRAEQRWEDRMFTDLPDFIGPGDCLVLNNSRVFPSRLFGRRVGVRATPMGERNPAHREYLGARVEVMLLRPTPGDPLTWSALVRPGRKMRTGERIEFELGLTGEIVAWGEFGERTIRFTCDGDIWEKLHEIGHVPLPPYIRRADEKADRERYQTVFASRTGSVAAPTAGLHFTPEVLARCREAGAEIAHVTLHVGLGTFQPLRNDQVEQAKLHSEQYEVAEESAQHMRAAKRLMAVGTTSVRTIETILRDGELRAAAGETDIFIYPGFEFRGVGAMLTNFHLPKSSLFMLVSAFAGRDLMLEAYRHAVEQRYRFFSYGDCMLIL